MFWLQQEQKRKECLGEKKPKKGLVFEISSDDGFQICAESIEGENHAVLVVLVLVVLTRSKIITSEDLLLALFIDFFLKRMRNLLVYSPRTILVPDNVWILLFFFLFCNIIYSVTHYLYISHYIYIVVYITDPFCFINQAMMLNHSLSRSRQCGSHSGLSGVQIFPPDLLLNTLRLCQCEFSRG